MAAESAPSSPRRSRWTLVALIIALTFAFVLVWLPQTAGEQARRSLLAKLREHYPGLQIDIGWGRLVSGVGVVFEDVRIDRPADANGPARPILRMDRLVVETHWHTDQAASRLSDGELPLVAKRVVAHGVEIDLFYESHESGGSGQEGRGVWSMERLWPPPRMGPACPRIEISRGRVRVHPDTAANPPPRFSTGNAMVSPMSRPSSHPVQWHDLNLVVNIPPIDDPDQATHEFSLDGAGELVDHLRIRGTHRAGTLVLVGAATGVRTDPTMMSRMPSPLTRYVAPLAGLTARGDLSGKCVIGPSVRPRWEAKWVAHDGILSHPSLAQSIQGLRGVVRLSDRGARIETVQATIGESICRLSGVMEGWEADADLQGRVVATDLMLGDQFTNLLPPAARQALDELKPAGRIHLDSRLDRRGGIWRADAVVDLLGVDVRPAAFPYPISQLVGKLHFRDSQIWSERLSGRVANQRVSAAFQKAVRLPAKGPGWIEIACEGPIPIDATFLAALTARGEKLSSLERVVRSLGPRGEVHLVSGRFAVDDLGQKSHCLDLRVAGGSVRYDPFPYPLHQIQGRLDVDEKSVRFIDFRGKSSNNATVLCEGIFEKPVAHRGSSGHGSSARPWQLSLSFRASEVPLDETLRAALVESSRSIWDELSPTGVLDEMDVHVLHDQSREHPKIEIAARQRERPVLDSRTLSLRPTTMPYRIDVISGAAHFDGSEVIIESLNGRHDASRVSADGRCAPTADGRWKLDLNLRSGSRLHCDSEWIGSLPAQVRGSFQRLQLRGPLSVRGTTSLLLPDARHPEPMIAWGLTLQLEGNRIGDVGPVHDLRGEIAIQGRRDGAGVVADGLVSIDSVHVGDQQITAIKGPFAIRDDRLFLGETLTLVDELGGVSSEGPMPAPPLQGKLFGGIITLSGDMLLSDGNFDVTFAVQQADVATLLADLGQLPSGISGKVEGRVRLEGTFGLPHLLKGNGSAVLSQANVYQLPVLIQFFNLLRIKPSEAVAFTHGDARFSIYGDSVTFSQLQLWGDLIAVHGTGTMIRGKEIDLSFNTRVSPQNEWDRLVRTFGDHQYTLWTINVKGSLANPAIERRALDAVNDTLERMFPGIADPMPPRTRLGRLGKRWID